MKKTYEIEVDCANCANKLEDMVVKTSGVKSAAVNFMLQKLSVDFEEGADADAVIRDIARNCKKIDDDCEIHI